jgi:adenylate cyclase
MSAPLTIDDLRRCIEGRIPPIIGTASAAGEPNVVFISSVNIVDSERIALSNQFMGKTATNLAENPRASLVLTDPHSGSEYRLSIVYERTERRGPTFERLKAEVDEIAQMTGCTGVFRLRSADIYRIERIDVANEFEHQSQYFPRRPVAQQLAALGELTRRLSRCSDLDTMVAAAVRGLDELLGYERSMVMLLDETGRRLFTIASHGFATQGVGSELAVGQGAAGIAVERNRAVRLGGVQNTAKYASRIGTAFDGSAGEIQVPESSDTRSRLAVPGVSRGEVLGVVVVESSTTAAFDDSDETVVGIVASIIAEMAELDRVVDDDGTAPVPAAAAPVPAAAAPVTAQPVQPNPAPLGETHVRFFASDGSVFLDGDHLIRGVAGRILWSLVQRHVQTGQIDFTTKEIRLDKSLQLPGFRDNLDARMILLKRRLEERNSPIQLERTGRGRIAMRLGSSLRLEVHD